MTLAWISSHIPEDGGDHRRRGCGVDSQAAVAPDAAFGVHSRVVRDEGTGVQDGLADRQRVRRDSLENRGHKEEGQTPCGRLTWGLVRHQGLEPRTR